MTNPPLFIIFIDSVISSKLVKLIEDGKIHCIIFTYPSLKLKKIFSKFTKGQFQIKECDLPFNFHTFNILLTSKSFWDNIDNKHSHLYILYNPKALGMEINLQSKNKPFFIHSFEHTDINKFIRENPSISDEAISKGFIAFINIKFAKQTIKNFTKTHILNIRKELKMQNTEHIERQVFTPFYLYFYHNMIRLGYNS